MSRLPSHSKGPEIIAAGRRALERSRFAKGCGKMSSLVLSITTPKFELRLNREIRDTTDNHESGGPGQFSAALARPSAAYAFQSGQGIRPSPTRKNANAISFWETLTDVERLDFVKLARERVFAVGATLMREGAQANHVVVISSGRVRVYVQENGRERTLAERGPGDLIGERAALEVSVRSATIVALEEVRALVVKTEDFRSAGRTARSSSPMWRITPLVRATTWIAWPSGGSPRT